VNRLGGERRETAFGTLLFVVALVPRLFAALAYAGEPVWDGHYYDYGARRIAAGLGYSDDRTVAGHLVWHPWCHYPVGYSAFLALCYRVLGASQSVAAVVNALVGAAVAVVTWALARWALSSARARGAGLIVALHPGLILYAALVMTEPLAALLTLSAFWLAVRDAHAFRGIVVGSLVLGVAALVRPQALLCAPFMAVLGGNRAPARLRAALAACLVALVPVLPWTARNCRVMDGCALVSTNTGWNLAIGSFPRATGRFETLRSSDGCRDVTGQVQQDRCWFRYALGQIAARPMRWLALMPAKLGYTFDHESFAVEYLHEARPDAWPEPKRVFARGITSLVHRLVLAAAALGGIAFPLARRARPWTAQGVLLVVTALLGVIAFTRDSPTLWPVAVWAAVAPWLPVPGRPKFSPALALALGLLGTTIATHAIFFGEDRYHVIVTPVVAILAAAALRPPRPSPERAAALAASRSRG
jgi:4-amino-4-deoxy-L-arabinose transferase-like glycosyltransferase